ncbi:MAG: hypothetical protein CTY15_01830 [Methylocystis sp.]|nr:MAG: hypothetical protein CTY15_01830 [Methylocystis sp.]
MKRAALVFILLLPASAHAASDNSTSCLEALAHSIARNTPARTGLGPGSAEVTFHVKPGGFISGVTVSGSTPEHAALARRIVAGSRGRKNCGSADLRQSLAFH